ncbi:hypothetical protein EBX93_11595, partial [bacterium]|nr:hypothetical protein [bacterium]
MGSVIITYTVTVSGCSNAVSYTLNVADGSNITAPGITAQGSTGLCGNSNVQICPTVWGWNNYQWYQNGTPVTQDGIGACITVDTSKLGIYTLSATNSNGCWSPQSNAIVVAAATTPATPVVTVLGGVTSTCNGQSITLSSSASTGNQWKKDGVAINGATAQTYQATTSGTYTVTVTDNCGGTATSTGTTLTITPSITINSIQSNSSNVCTGNTTTLSNTTTGGVWSSSNTSVATINANTGVVTGVDTGSVTITYTVSVGACTNSVSMNLTVIDGSNITAPTIAAQSSTSICGSATVTLCTATYGWSNYQWYKNGNAVVDENSACITVDTSALGSYTLAATIGSGCWSFQSSAIVVSAATVLATPIINASGSTSLCNGGSVLLTSSAATGNHWYKDGVAINGAIGQVYQASTSGVYTVSVNDNCGSIISSTGTSVNVAPEISLGSIQSNGNSICTGNTTTLTNISMGGVWTSNNTAVATIDSTTGQVKGVDTGSVIITYTLSMGSCSNSVSIHLSVLDGSSIAVPAISSQGSTSICGSTTVTLCTAAYGWSNYQWYKDGSVVLNGTGSCITVDTSKVGSYTLAAALGSGCWSAQSNPLVVTSSSLPPTPIISASGSTSTCNGEPVLLTSSATMGNQWYKDGITI